MARICTDDKSKELIGQLAEDLFEHEGWICSCGGSFIRQAPPHPDYQCFLCSQEVDVKGAPEAEDHGAITISEVPFNKYPPSMIIAWRRRDGYWHGIRREDAISNGPHKPAHKGKRPTRFYIVSLDNFVLLEELITHAQPH